MCTCEYMYVYKEVLSVSIRKVTHICTTSVRIQINLWYDICTLLKMSMYTKRFNVWALARGTNICEFVRHGFMYKTIYIYMYTCVCFKVCTGKAATYVISHNLSSYTKVSTIRYMYACGWMYIYKEILSVWVREGRDICEFAQHQFIYKSSDDIIHVYLWIYVCMQDHTRGSKCECVRGQEHTRYMKCCIEMLYIWVLTVVNFRASNSYE